MEGTMRVFYPPLRNVTSITESRYPAEVHLCYEAQSYSMRTRLSSILVLSSLLLWSPVVNGESNGIRKDPGAVRVPILLYHRFGLRVSDAMTVTTDVFRSHLEYIKDRGFTVIPLRQLINYYLGKGPPPSQGSVVIVADDAHKSVYTDMLPLVRQYNVPVTLFVYPSAISKASYAMTWAELRELKETGLFDFQGHTFWHPNFKKEKRRLKPDEYEKFVEMQLKKSGQKLERELGVHVDMLAWPFGIYDDELILKAREAGYGAAFTIERRHAAGTDNIMKLPRYIMVNADQGMTFERLLSGNRDTRE